MRGEEELDWALVVGVAENGLQRHERARRGGAVGATILWPVVVNRHHAAHYRTTRQPVGSMQGVWRPVRAAAWWPELWAGSAVAAAETESGPRQAPAYHLRQLFGRPTKALGTMRSLSNQSVWNPAARAMASRRTSLGQHGAVDEARRGGGPRREDGVP